MKDDGMIIRNLDGIFTGESFWKSQGRDPARVESDYVSGPVDIEISNSGRIAKIGRNLPGSVSREWNGRGLVATSGIFDSHTHALFSGQRSAEFFQRWGGETYVQIAQKGGGIQNTMRATSAASDPDLITGTLARLNEIARCGVTNLEIKSGYAASAAGELRLLRVLKKLRSMDLPLEIHPTFLGLHALPEGRTEKDFVDEMISLLPIIQKEGLAFFVDAFPEKGFFSLEESLRFAKLGLQHGLRPKIHADELSPLGSAENFAQLGALSVDHLQRISTKGLETLAGSPCVATLLPATSFYLGMEYAPAKKLFEHHARVALSTDFNPGTAPDFSPQFTMKLAASQLKMTPSQIFCAFTLNGAAALGMETGGYVAPGATANLCLWRASLKTLLEEIAVCGIFPEKTLRGSESFPQRP
jgi:imidazolonepropionase